MLNDYILETVKKDVPVLALAPSAYLFGYVQGMSKALRLDIRDRKNLLNYVNMCVSSFIEEYGENRDF